MTTITTQPRTESLTNLGVTIPFDGICEPGAYVCNWSGHLLRVPGEALSRGMMPTINIVGDAPLTVTKLSDNPFIALSKAKATALEYRIPVNF